MLIIPVGNGDMGEAKLPQNRHRLFLPHHPVGCLVRHIVENALAQHFQLPKRNEDLEQLFQANLEGLEPLLLSGRILVCIDEQSLRLRAVRTRVTYGIE
jgi:hypothetical protein